MMAREHAIWTIWLGPALIAGVMLVGMALAGLWPS